MSTKGETIMTTTTLRIGSPSAYAGLPCRLVSESKATLTVRIHCPGSTQHGKIVSIDRRSPGVVQSDDPTPAEYDAALADSEAAETQRRGDLWKKLEATALAAGRVGR